MLFINASTAFASENWQKIGDNFYVDVNSIDKQYGDYVTGYFKQINPNKTVKRKQVSYTKIWTGAYCDEYAEKLSKCC